MAARKASPQASVTEVLDRVLDRGIVIDAWLRVSVAGIGLIDVDARIVVASIETYLREADAIAAVTAPSGAGEAAPAPTPKAVRRLRRPRRRLHCSFGCTFIRAAKNCPEGVRCPSDRSRVCPVAPIPAAV